MTLRRCVLFTALVRLNLEYCLMVWSPYTKRNIDKLERVQRRATKFILKSDDPYDWHSFEEVKPHTIAEEKITDWCDILIQSI